jgi:Zn-dependent M28 family amino/carboxypeptidase
MRPFFLTVFILWMLASCSDQAGSSSSANGKNDSVAIFADSLKMNIQVLSSDSFLGRKPFTEGETKTISYLEKQFKSLGLEPGNGGSFFQEVPMVSITTQADSVMQVNSPKGNFTLRGFDDYVVWTEKTDPQITIKNSDLVFAGYGVVAPERGWNDYAGLDVRGKVVLVMVNDPGYGIDNSLFRGDTMTYYGRWTYKFEEAARQGAKGCLVIHETKAASYNFSVVQNSWNTTRLRLDDRGSNTAYCDAVGWVTRETAIRLFEAGGYDSTLFTGAAKKGFKAISLPVKLSTGIKVSTNFNKSNNVIAKITGSKYPDEQIIYTAHWDHLGIGKADERGDSIYNGALDNASGTAGLIELARSFKRAATPPERTIVFLAVTAEEQGLWGSAYYAMNPVYPLNKTLANINMDGLSNRGATKDVVVVGQGQSELEDVLKDIVKQQDRTLAFESHPEAGYYYRSDHFNFAKAGVPALYIKTGTDVEGKGKEFGQSQEDEYRAKHYHRPSDELNDSWDLGGAIADLRLLYLVGKQLASVQKFPEWKTGSEFKPLRDTMMKK